ncbi:MAG: complex I NDUFA9 subunit family protein [Burkholderiales bacterium]
MNQTKICILGGSGFVGSHIVSLLAAQGTAVRVVTAKREHAKTLFVFPSVEIVEANIHDEVELARVTNGCDSVINLVGVLHDSRKHGKGFRHAHVELARKVITACKANGIERLLHMSALKAHVSAPSGYLRSKGKAEQLVRDSGLKWTIFCPSVIFGRGDNFLNLFASLLSVVPLMPLAGAKAKFQPVWVEDVAQAFVNSLQNRNTFGQSYNLCGPKKYTLHELVQLVASIKNVKRIIIGLPAPIAKFQALVMEYLPGKLMSRDNLLSMEVDSTCDCDFPAVFGFTPSALESIAAQFLSQESMRSRFNVFRAGAGRK